MSDPRPPILSDERLNAAHAQVRQLVEALETAVYGQRALLERAVLGLSAGGHILIEGLPGLGKTELVKALAAATGLEMKRVQFTPDLLPGDISGSHVVQMVDGDRRFVFQKGPVFCQILLADEINRASPKTQSALLQAMQEGEVTVLGETHTLPHPFFVVATQNPIELEGTYPLPEAQLDRFLLKLDIRRTGLDDLEKILFNRRPGQGGSGVPTVMNAEGLLALQQTVQEVYLPPVVGRYIARLVEATHADASKAAAHVRHGASPRAAIALAAVSRARALLHQRPHADFSDVQAMAVPVLQHRIILDHSARLDGLTGAGLVERLLQEVLPQEKNLPDILQPLPQG
ncbi:MAG: MoxR family ATPase [Verrucomicrobiota bacterium JB022]|nr:MoxR family ATPase [Verrucomicrobiota bacterium JB022]